MPAQLKHNPVTGRTGLKRFGTSQWLVATSILNVALFFSRSHAENDINIEKQNYII